MAGVTTKLLATRTIYLVEQGPNPSTDYFLMPVLKGITTPIIRCRWSSPLPKAQELAGATVIFVRYVPTGWKRLIKRTHHNLAELVYFMDDDLWDYRAAAGLSFKYRFKLARYATRHRRWLQAVHATLWVSTPWLVNKYAAQQPRLIMPALPLVAPSPTAAGTASVVASTSSLSTSKTSTAESTYSLPTSKTSVAAGSTTPTAHTNDAAPQTLKIFYHGSASHRADIAWLHPVIQTVLARNTRLQFEIIGDARTKALYGGLERCTVLSPMSWPAYQALIATPGRHIGLAPAVPHPFNQARSHTKFFDITQAGAVGIYAARGPCQGVLKHQQHGLLVEMTPEAWVEAILLLADDHTLRQDLYAHAVTQSYTLSNL
jgi:hypothetical protein